eukprot:snap_masked-scaffold_39-processed-gene-2.41-mRNA-1 protein AED:1.00 eAED:1.00 QI:0/-1/0/0/-1/1/1/0/190
MLFILRCSVIFLRKFKNKIKQRGEKGFFIGYNYVSGEGLILSKQKRELIKTRNFKITRQYIKEKIQEKEIQELSKLPYIPKNMEKENTVNETEQYNKENTVNETEQYNKENTVTEAELLLAEEYVGRSKIKTKESKRLTYADMVTSNNMFLFKDLGFIFQHYNLMDYATAAIGKDNSIPKTYFQIKIKPC